MKYNIFFSNRSEQNNGGEKIKLCFQLIFKLVMLWTAMMLLAACGPTITNLEPAAGEPGDKIIITGSNLTVGGKNPSSVDFNGAAANFKAVGNNVESEVPIGAATGPVHVKTSKVDFFRLGGTAESPFDFTVVNSAFTETENNDERDKANNANLAQVIKGSITDQDDGDWFKVNSGPSGPWGYGIEIVADPKNLPEGVQLRIDIEGYRADLGKIGYLTTYADDKPFTLWMTIAPNTDIFLNVTWVGSTSEIIMVDYTLKIARIKISDTNEDDSTINTPKEIKMSNGSGVYKSSYLCNILKNGEDIGMQDFYFFNPNGATTISVTVLSPPLNQSDEVRVSLYDNTKTYRTIGFGNNILANCSLQLSGGESASGQWYIEVTNAWDHYETYGAGPDDEMPLSCKGPYTIMVITK